MALRVYPTLSNRARRLDSHPCIVYRGPLASGRRTSVATVSSSVGRPGPLGAQARLASAVWCPVGLIAALVILR